MLPPRQGKAERFGQNGMRQRYQAEEEVCWIGYKRVAASCGGPFFRRYRRRPMMTDRVFGLFWELPPVMAHQRFGNQGIGIGIGYTCRISLTRRREQR